MQSTDNSNAQTVATSSVGVIATNVAILRKSYQNFIIKTNLHLSLHFLETMSKHIHQQKQQSKYKKNLL